MENMIMSLTLKQPNQARTQLPAPACLPQFHLGPKSQEVNGHPHYLFLVGVCPRVDHVVHLQEASGLFALFADVPDSGEYFSLLPTMISVRLDCSRD